MTGRLLISYAEMIRSIFRLILIGLLILGADAQAQTEPATAPSTGPATTRRARWEMTIPAGFVKVVVSQDRQAICTAEDESWVKAALSSAAPATKPSTMPANLIELVQSHRDPLVKQIASDFAISDTGSINKLIDETVIPDLKKLLDFHAPIYFLVIEREKLREIVKGGWGAPKFYYNRVADEVSFQNAVALSLENMDDFVLPVTYKSTDSPEQKQQQLRNAVTEMESGIDMRIAAQGQILLQQALIHFMDQQVFAPIKPEKGQEWFAIGVEGVYSARYVAMVNSAPVEGILRDMTRDQPGNPIRTHTIDLLHLTPPAQLKPQYSAAYFDAMRRKSVSVVNGWLAKSPQDAVAKVVAAIAKSKPADGDALLKIIKDETGADLKEQVQAKF
jgi:hypothetical protein